MKYRLPKEFAEKWTAALRSGKYEQTNEELYDGNGFCCLGVACVIAGHQKWRLKGHPWPSKAIKSVRVPDEIKTYDGSYSLVAKLADLNDNNGYSFNQIADWIDENVEKY